MADGKRRKPDWDALERARIARARDYYRETTPGERVESALLLSRELTALAARGRTRR